VPNLAKNQPFTLVAHRKNQQQLATQVRFRAVRPVLASALTFEVFMARKRSNGCGSVQSHKHPGIQALGWAAKRAVLIVTLSALSCAATYAQSVPTTTQPTATSNPAAPTTGTSTDQSSNSTASPTAPPAAQTSGQQGTPPAGTPATGTAGSTTAPSTPSVPVEGTYDEVHVKPRELDKKDPNAAPTKGFPGVPTPGEIDPSLKTNTKPMRVDVDLVLIPVTVTDPMNRLVTGLEKENFSLWDNGQKEEIRHFSSEDAPISLGVIFDMSGSMNNKVDKAKEAVVEFFKTANPDDEFFMIAFNDKPEMISDFTSSIEQIQGQLVYAIPRGRTALLDAIYMGLAKMRKAQHQKKALLIISDGGDNHSRYTENEIKSMVKEADVQIFAIGVFDNSPGTPEEQNGPITLASITDVTGGRTFTIDNPSELSDVATKIGVELRNQYVLGYRPKKAARDGKWRKIKVKLNPPKGLPPLTVYNKTGYYAPNE
jgi:Ca-activated chloride channel family protein